jgi:hypothetical protein
MVEFQTGHGMVLKNGSISGYLVRVGLKEVWFREFELKEKEQ